MINHPTDNSPWLPPVSLVICTRNRPQMLVETVESVLQGDQVPAEIVIVDQSAEPNFAIAEMEQPRGCRIRYLLSLSVGLCWARNIAVGASSTSILAFIDDDMRVEHDWFGSLIRSLVQAGPRAIVTGRVLPADDRPGGFVPTVYTSEVPRTYHGRIGTDILAAGHMAMYRSTIDEIGPFDERLGAGSSFPAADDNDYGYRLLEAGYQIAYVPQAVVYHRAWRAKRDFFPMRWNYGRGKGGYYRKYCSLRDPYMLRRMCWDIGVRVARFPWRVLHRPELAVGDLVYASGILWGAAKWSLGRGQPSRVSLPTHYGQERAGQP